MNKEAQEKHISELISEALTLACKMGEDLATKRLTEDLAKLRRQVEIAKEALAHLCWESDGVCHRIAQTALDEMEKAR